MLLWAVGACGASDPQSPPARSSSDISDLRECFSDGMTDPWRPQWPPGGLLQVQANPDMADAPSGTVSTTKAVYTYDRTSIAVWSPDPPHQRIGSIGRTGGGPGEFAPSGARMVFPIRNAVQWIDVSGDTIAAFDGNTVHLFESSGLFIGVLKHLPEIYSGVLPFSGRLRRYGSGIVIDMEARRVHDGPTDPAARAYRLWQVDPSGATVLATIDLPPLPTGPRGGFYHGTGEASPLWSLHGDCFVISDGGSDRLIVGRIGSTRLDTLSLPSSVLPIAQQPQDDDSEALLGRIGVSGPVPAPSLPRRFSAMKIDPAGWIWLLPVQAPKSLNDPLRVVRIAVGSREIRIDSIPAFPLIFREPDAYYGGVLDSATGERVLFQISGQR